MNKHSDMEVGTSGVCWFCGQAISDLAAGNCGNCDNGKLEHKRKNTPEDDTFYTPEYAAIKLIESQAARIAELEADTERLIAGVYHMHDRESKLLGTMEELLAEYGSPVVMLKLKDLLKPELEKSSNAP